MVLGGRADHRRPADIDILDTGLEIRTGGDGRLERVEIDHDEVDRGDAVLVHRGNMGRIRAAGEDAAMNQRMQRLDPAIHDLRKACMDADFRHGNACVHQRFGGAAGRQDLDALGGKKLSELDKAGLVGHRNKRPGDLWCGLVGHD